jgi:hypothetical protein
MQILRSDHRYSKYCPPVPGTKPDEKSSGFFVVRFSKHIHFYLPRYLAEG